MSLDVYLTGAERVEACSCEACGHAHERRVRPTVFEANITHNLNKMADRAGIYEALWRPEEIQVTTAVQLVPLLTAGLAKLKANPAWFEQFGPPNGWGKHQDLVAFVTAYLTACQDHPGATVRVSR